MAINTYRFWMATDANRLLANQFAFVQANVPAFYQGNVANLELHIVASAGVGTSPVEVPFPAGASISVAVGNTNSYPTGGSWELSVNDVETQPMPYNATPVQVAEALNALTDVSAAGGVAVSKTGDGYTITWNTYGAKPTIGIGSDTLTPSSYESISLVQTGSAEHRQIVFVELRQNPIALGTTWTPLPTPSVSVSELQAWNGTNRIWRVGIEPQPKAGTITIAYGTKTATLSYDASPSQIASALSPAQVFATGQFQWDIVIDEDSVLTAFGSLVGYNGYFGSINFATAECHQFLAGAERKGTTLEVSISLNDKRYTLIQTPCNVLADVVSDGVIAPLPLGVAISEQVANARFVRRDIDQNPDAATQDVIWQNLGVETLGSDVAGALNAADSPSAANPFATISDIPTVTSAVWGQITGDIANQSDLDYALASLDNLKYDKSNPAGYITQADVSGFATQQWVIDQNYLSSSASDINFSGYNITFSNGVKFEGLDGKAPINIGATFIQPGGTLSNGDMWFNTSDGRLGYYYTQQSGSGVRYAATTTDLQLYYLSSNPQGFITSSALTPYATLANPNFTGVAKFVNPWNYGIVLDDPSSPGYSTSIGMQSIAITQGGSGGENINVGFDGFKRSSGSQYYGLLGVSTLSIVNPTGSIVLDHANGLRKDGVELYARKSGDFFTGKVSFTSVGGNAGLNVGIGGVSTTANTAGDMWIATGGTNLNFRDGTGAWRILVNTSNTNNFSAPQIIDTTSSTPALRITQKGIVAGQSRAIVVEDETTPDQNCFIIDQSGNVGVGVSNDPNNNPWVAGSSKIEVIGDVKATTFSNGTGPAFSVNSTSAHTGGTDTLDLIVTIGGVQYRVGLRPV